MPPNLRPEIPDDLEDEEIDIGTNVEQEGLSPGLPTLVAAKKELHTQEVAKNDGIQAIESWSNLVDLEAPTEPEHAARPPQQSEAEGESPPSSHREIRHFIRKQAVKMHHGHRHASIDQTRLMQATKDAGYYAFGIMAVEVWVWAKTAASWNALRVVGGTRSFWNTSAECFQTPSPRNALNPFLVLDLLEHYGLRLLEARACAPIEGWNHSRRSLVQHQRPAFMSWIALRYIRSNGETSSLFLTIRIRQRIRDSTHTWPVALV